MNKINRRFMLAIVTASSAYLLPSISAQDAPTADSIIKQSIVASGGYEKYAKLKSVEMSGELSMPSLGLKGTIEMSYERPEKLLVTIKFGEFATVKQGRNGEIAWETSTIATNRKLSAKEADETMEGVSLLATFEPEKIFEKFELTGEEKVNGIDCYVIKVTRKSNDEEEIIYFAKDTYLPVRTVANRTTEAGRTKVVSDFSEYKEIDGLMLCMRLKNDLTELGMVQDIRFKEIHLNREIAPETFTVPDEFMPASEAKAAATVE